MKIKIKRIYEEASAADGWRVLVDRLWPRGVRREEAQLDEWAKEVTPSDALRKWYGHDPGKWDEFSKKYRAELEEKTDELTKLLESCPEKTMTLLFAAKDETHSHAVVLKEVLDEQLKQ
ncbi:DUF488 domain-containing protein [Tichowtungia aerotolerans]|uniref:DUF488 family protein n=1 Tax=Tichowtungia aerotolerans TaxID=2697043 RepID=A0A6P1M596_9BACT|nr:DUF488 domain-containing protein [Tichowtungia aerotolerans]QHI69011.1 DUF488 family protein [Tichowtungia aerotolerans]